MNHLGRRTQPTTKGPISPLRMARATSLAITRHIDTQPASTTHTVSTTQTATPQGIVILGPSPQLPPGRQFHKHLPCSSYLADARNSGRQFHHARTEATPPIGKKICVNKMGFVKK
uniref:Uncharacterized protein n=1 Tax=Arundo donax TaxID=35708 RepID=A0A0A9CIR6_ARUDO